MNATTTWDWNTNSRIVPHEGDNTLVFNNESGWAARFSGKGLSFIEDIYQKRSIANGDERQYPQVLLNLLKAKRVLIDHQTADAYYEEINKKLKSHIQDIWRLTILPTERCNFNCYYCYEERIRGKMKKAVAEGTDKLVAHMASHAPAFELSFFGGEPLLAPDLMLRYLKTACEHVPDKDRFTASVTTNGSLITPELAKELSSNQLGHYQITLDGPKHMHDKQRVSKSGKGTYTEVIRGLEILHELDDPKLSVGIRVNMHAGLADDYLGLLDDPSIKKIMQDKRFFFSIHEIWESEKFRLSEDQQGPRDNVQRIKKAFLDFEQASKGVTIKRPVLGGPCSEACYAGKPNQYVIYPTGHVGKCTVVLEEGRNHIGRVNVDGSLTLNDQKHAYWIGQNALKDEDCKSCAYRITCSGIGCPIGRVKPGDGSCTLRDAYDKGWGHALVV